MEKNIETGYCQLKQKEVVNLKDGRKLGRVCDVVFTFPEGKTLGIVVPGGRGFFRPGVFIDLRNIVKIGEDTILVEVRPAPKTTPPKRGHGYIEHEDDCPPSKSQSQSPSQSRHFEEDE